MNKKAILCIFMALAITFTGFSQGVTVSVTAPTFDLTPEGNSVGLDIDDVNDMNNGIKAMFDGLETDLNSKLSTIGTIDAGNLLSGFGASSVFASHGATMRGYAEFKSFSISVGAMAGLKLPDGSLRPIINGIFSGDFSAANEIFKDYIDDPFSLLTGGKKLDVGFNPQLINLNLGFKPSSLIKSFPKNLSFGLQFGYFGGFNIGDIVDLGEASINLDILKIGATVNYQLIPTISIAGLIKWRGINISSGFIYQSTKFGISMPLPDDLFSGDSSYSQDGATVKINPKMTFDLEVNSFTIPVEATTAITLLFLNVPLGIGFDLGFGNNKIVAGVDADISVTDPNGYFYQTSSGNVNMNLAGTSDINVFNWKIMTGLGITIGDFFIIDIPITYYFNDGLNVGVTLAVRF